MAIHCNHRFDDYDDPSERRRRICTAGCGQTWGEVQDARAARAAARQSDREGLTEQHLWAQERERRLTNDLRRERRQLYGR